MRRAAIAAISLLMTSGAVCGQEWPLVATDTELFAAYCVGALKSLPSAAEQDQRERFRAYLASRAIGTAIRGPATTNGINLAAERGHRDVTLCRPQPGGEPACKRVARCMTAENLPF